jgi:hypothetical protein
MFRQCLLKQYRIYRLMNKLNLRNDAPIYYEGIKYFSINVLAMKLNISLPHVNKLLESGMLLDEALKVCTRAKTQEHSSKSMNTMIDLVKEAMSRDSNTKFRIIKSIDNYEDLKPLYTRLANEEIKAIQLENLAEKRKKKLCLLLPKERETFSYIANNHPQIKPALFELQSSLKFGCSFNGHYIILVRAPKKLALNVTCASILSIHSLISTDIKIEKIATFLELVKPWDLHSGIGSDSLRKFEEAVKSKAMFFDLESEYPTNTEQQAIARLLRARWFNKLTVITVFHERPLIHWCGNFLLESLKEGTFTDISLFDKN